tara:strand:+ start:23093 stop:23377 length:285 start_codon:yes stop_codon:yes gene_type:complete
MKTKEKSLKLKPSSRDKRRYFLVKSSNSKVESAILEYIGILGFSKSAYMRIYSKDFPRYLIGSCLTKSMNDIRAALALEGISIEKVSGTLKGLK